MRLIFKTQACLGKDLKPFAISDFCLFYTIVQFLHFGSDTNEIIAACQKRCVRFDRYPFSDRFLRSVSPEAAPRLGRNLRTAFDALFHLKQSILGNPKKIRVESFHTAEPLPRLDAASGKTPMRKLEPSDENFYVSQPTQLQTRNCATRNFDLSDGPGTFGSPQASDSFPFKPSDQGTYPFSDRGVTEDAAL